VDSIEQILGRDAVWRPPRGETSRWIEAARAASAPASLLQEARWWEAHEAALGADWDRVSTLASEGLAEPFSEREAVRLALLHAISGDLGEAEHVLSQAVQWTGGEALLRRFAELCASEGLAEAAARFRRISAPADPPPSAPAR
jgi:hypothetical protein